MKGFWSFVAQIVFHIVGYLTRRKSLGVVVMRLGVGMTATGSIGLVLRISANDLPLISEFSLALTEANTWPLTICSGLVVILFGGALVWLERRGREKRTLIALELRGLRNLSGNPVSDFAEEMHGCKANSVLVDLTTPYTDGRIDDPNAALGILQSSLPSRVHAEANDSLRSDVGLVFGGLAPVPFTLLAGQLIDDERQVEIIDWDRRQKRWRQLDGVDDGNRLELIRSDAVEDHEEVCLVISFSYNADVIGCEQSFPGLPIRHLSLREHGTDAHWSEHKQKAVASQFIDEMVALSGKSIKRVHLVLAGPSSLVFRFGTHVENRNWPDVIIYQYERGREPCYPWGIKLPMRGAPASIIRIENAANAVEPAA